MSAYYFDEGVIDLPAGWTDKTVHVLSATAPDGSSYGLLMNRERLPDGSAFEAFVEERLAQLPRALRGYKLLGQRESTLGGLPAREVKLLWKHDSGMLFHYQAFVAVYGAVITLTGSARASFAAECEAWMTSVLASLRFREP